MIDPLAQYRDLAVTLDGLVAAAGALLAAGGPAQSDGRVTALPDARALRYYQTLGLVSRPLRYDGRQAVYGYRHLLELLAVKLLQARRTPLSLIQRSLAGATTAALETAVVDGLGLATPAPAGAMTVLDITQTTPDDPPGRPWVAEEVRPGVVVTVDPARVSDPGAVLGRIRSCLSKRQGGES
jgi:hypothetical protein